MDPRERADATLARARARGAFVVTPESAVSPMDAASTLQIPRAVVSANDDRQDDPEATMVVPGSLARGGPLPSARSEEHLPAIAQEAMTDVVGTPPGMRSRQRRLEDAKARQQQAAAQRQQAAAQPSTPVPAPAAEPDPIPRPQPSPPEDLDGLIPTTKQPPTSGSSLSQRLDG